MAFARDVYTATGGQTDFTISFPYLDDAHITVSQNGTTLTEVTHYTFPNATTVRLVTGATAGDTIVLKRATSPGTRLVDYTAGVLVESDLDTDSLQGFYLAQESSDTADLALGLDNTDNWDVEGRRITNVAEPVDLSDAATKRYVDTRDGARYDSEEQTATASQTVFTLTNISYEPGVGNLSVYINGVRQAPSAYTETSGSVVTFTSGLTAGDLVQFVSSETTTTAATSAASVTYDPGVTGSVQTNVQDKLRESYSVKDFGAAGDGVTDDTAALQTAINNASGGRLDLLGLTYKVTSSLSLPSGLVMYNGTLDGSAMASGDTLLEALGTMGSSTAMNTISPEAASFVVSSAAGITEEAILYLESATIFGSGGTTNGELIKVRGIAGTTITPYRVIYDDYQSSQVFYIPTMVKNIQLSNVHLIGGGNGLNHIAFNAFLAENVVLENCSSEYFGDRHFQFLRSRNCRVVGCNASHSDTSTGLAYGFTALNGCDNITFTGCTGDDHRHGIAIGAENGVDRNITVSGCSFTACTDGALDCHPQSQYIVFDGNICSCGSTESTQDGISAQGTDVIVSNNVVEGYSRVGILLQPLCVNSNFKDSTVCTGNNILRAIGAGSIYGISYDNQRAGGAARVNISNNNIVTTSAAGYGILVDVNVAATNGTVSGLVVTGNNIRTRRDGIKVSTDTLKLIRSGTISNNSVETVDTTTYDGICIAATTANYIERITISANSIYGGRYGINNSNGQRIVAYSNMIQAFGTAATNGLTAEANNYTT